MTFIFWLIYILIYWGGDSHCNHTLSCTVEKKCLGFRRDGDYYYRSLEWWRKKIMDPICNFDPLWGTHFLSSLSHERPLFLLFKKNEGSPSPPLCLEPASHWNKKERGLKSPVMMTRAGHCVERIEKPLFFNNSGPVNHIRAASYVPLIHSFICLLLWRAHLLLFKGNFFKSKGFNCFSRFSFHSFVHFKLTDDFTVRPIKSGPSTVDLDGELFGTS